MTENKQVEKLEKTLFKKAVGYVVDEIVEEYVGEENELKLVKKKITKKHIPPDLNAARALIDGEFDSIKNLHEISDEELLLMRKKIINEIKESNKELCK